MLSRLGRGILSVLIVWCLFIIMGTPAVSGLLEGSYYRLSSLRGGSSAESALTALIPGEQMLHRPVCSGRMCAVPTIALNGYHLPELPGVVIGNVKLILEPSWTYEAMEGGYFVNPRFARSASRTVLFSAQERAAGEAAHILDEVLPSGETKPVLAAEEGYFVSWQGAADEDAESAADPDVAVADASDVRWRQVVYQPLNRLLKLAVTDSGSAVDAGDWVVLYTNSPQMLRALPLRRDLLIGRVRSVVSVPGGAVIEVDTTENYVGSLGSWLKTRADFHEAIVKFTDEGFLMMSFKPDANEAAGGRQMSVEYEQRLFQTQQATTITTLWVVPESALDRECSVDRAPGTACVWVLLAGEAVPVQVSVVDLQAGSVGVIERRVFAGKGIAPQAWQRLSAVARRAWLMQVDKERASILDAGKVLATPWRG